MLLKLEKIKMINIKHFSNEELSSRVFEDEYLYRLRHRTRLLIETIDDMYIYDDVQLETLLNDIQEQERD